MRLRDRDEGRMGGTNPAYAAHGVDFSPGSEKSRLAWKQSEVNRDLLDNFHGTRS